MCVRGSVTKDTKDVNAPVERQLQSLYSYMDDALALRLRYGPSTSSREFATDATIVLVTSWPKQAGASEGRSKL